MAKLTTCGTCGHQVSSTATQCPNCGQKFKKKTSIFTWAIAALFGLPLLFAIFKSGSQPTQTASEPTKNNQKPRHLMGFFIAHHLRSQAWQSSDKQRFY